MRRRIVYNKRQSEIFYFMGLIMEFIRVTGENIEKSIYAVQFQIITMFRCLQKKRGLMKDLMTDWSF